MNQKLKEWETTENLKNGRLPIQKLKEGVDVGMPGIQSPAGDG